MKAMRIPRLRWLALLALFAFLMVSMRAGADSVIEQIIRYAAPRGFSQFPVKPVRDPFVHDGPGIEYRADDQRSSIKFQLGVINYISNNGRTLLLPAGQGGTSLERAAGSARPPGARFSIAPADSGKISGLPAALAVRKDSRGAKPSKDKYFCAWCVELETNFVVLISVSAADDDAFYQLTNSVESVRLDSRPLLKALFSNAPAPPKFDKGTTRSVEIGYLNGTPWPTAAFVFHLDQGLIFLNLVGAGDPLAHIDNVEKILNRAAQDAPDSPTRCVLSLESYRGLAPGGDGYVSFRFDWANKGIPTKRPPGLMRPDNESFSVFQSSQSAVPDGFHPIFNHPVSIAYVVEESDADTLLMRFSSLD